MTQGGLEKPEDLQIEKTSHLDPAIIDPDEGLHEDERKRIVSDHRGKLLSELYLQSIITDLSSFQGSSSCTETRPPPHPMALPLVSRWVPRQNKCRKRQD